MPSESRERSLQERARPPIPELVERRWEQDGYTYVRCERGPFDLRGTEWGQYGQAGTRLYFAVSNGRGAMSWIVLLRDYVNDSHEEGFTSGGLDWHYPPEMDQGFEGERDCDLLPGGKCRGDVGYSVAEPLEQIFRPGDEASEAMVLDWLREFCDEEFPRG